MTDAGNNLSFNGPAAGEAVLPGTGSGERAIRGAAPKDRLRGAGDPGGGPQEQAPGEQVLLLEGIVKRFPLPGDSGRAGEFFYALDGIDLCLDRGDFVVLGGANGSGKSLLMAIIAGLVKPSSGKVVRKASVGLVFQNPDLQILGETPWEDVLIGPKNQGVRGDELEETGRRALERVGLEEKAHFPSRSLSGGEKRRLAAAGILAMERDLIIFDEPFANLDYPGVRQTNALLSQLHREGRTVVVLTHELEKCLALATRFMVLHRGRLVFDGSPQDGLRKDLGSWAIRNPLGQYRALEDLVWS